MRVVTDDDKAYEVLRDEMIRVSIRWWRQAVEDPEKKMYMIWSPDWTKETKAKWTPVYKHLIKAIGRDKVAEETRKIWGRDLLRNLSKAGYVELPPSVPDHRVVEEWVRVNCPLASPPDWETQLFYTTIKLYLEDYGR